MQHGSKAAALLARYGQSRRNRFHRLTERTHGTTEPATMTLVLLQREHRVTVGRRHADSGTRGSFISITFTVARHLPASGL